MKLASLAALATQNLKFIMAGVGVLLSHAYLSHAQILVTADGPTHIENFDGLLSTGTPGWTNNQTIANWYLANSGTTKIAAYRTNAGFSHGMYSFGNTVDRSFGAINNSSLGNIAYACLFQNADNETINSINLKYKVEQWRKLVTTTKGYHRIKLSYRIGTTVNTDEAGLLGTGYVEIPEAFGFSPDTVSGVANEALDGNTMKVSFNVTFPVEFHPGEKFLLRFFDADEPGFDHGLGIDDLEITFRSVAANLITASTAITVPLNSPVSTKTLFPYLEQGIMIDIPPTGNYLVPDNGNLADWSVILDRFYQSDWDNVQAMGYGYQLVHYNDPANNDECYVLRKKNDSQYFWGTYVQRINPQNPILAIQAPHPIDDFYTERQSAGVFQLTGASDLMVAGISRCVHNEGTSCSGQTSVCSPSPQAYRKSDVAHNVNSIYQLATTALANLQPTKVFVQLHGFAQNAGDPHFIVSCGTLNGHLKSIPDYPVLLREQIINTDPAWEVKIGHVDNYDNLGGTNNVQGRFLNQYPFDVCGGTTPPATVTNRYVHIEQFNSVRRWASYYDEIAGIIGNVINATPYERQIPIGGTVFNYTQNFNSLSSTGTIHTWGNHVHLPGWHAVNAVNGLFGTYSTDNGSASTGALYAYGSGTDRALGTLSNAATGDIAYGVLFKNITGQKLTRMTLSYRAEQWRAETNASLPSQRVTLSYTISDPVTVNATSLLDNTLFTNIPQGDLVSLDDNALSGAVDGNSIATSIAGVIVPIDLDPGEELFIRFHDENVLGANKAMALDNFEISIDNSVVVEWKYFKVNKKSGSAQLLWGATDESKCERYEIQRSVNGIDFHTIGRMDCQLQKSVNQYEYMDDPPAMASIVYYRIAQFDVDGDFTFSPIAAYYQKKAEAPIITIEKDMIKVEAATDAKIQKVEVIDLLGRKLCDGKPSHHDIPNQYEIPCRSLPGQFVLIRVTLETTIFTMRFRMTE